MKTAFPNIEQIPFEGPHSKNPLAFKHYNADETVAGKTMTAQVLARELQLDLYRIDLSQDIRLGPLLPGVVVRVVAFLLRLDEGIGNGVQALGYDQFPAWRGVLSELGVERGAFSLGGTFHSPVIEDPAQLGSQFGASPVQRGLGYQ